MKTWQNFASGSGAAVTTWNYSAARGWLSGKRYRQYGGCKCVEYFAPH